MSFSDRRVVVTGLGALTPIGHSVPAFWDAMMEGRSGAAPITHFDASEYPTTFACEVTDFDPADYLMTGNNRQMWWRCYGLNLIQLSMANTAS